MKWLTEFLPRMIVSPKEIILGMIPVGTGNDWGRMFGIPLVYEGAVDVIKENKTMLHDIGIVSYYYRQ